jgi:hypothetical protein
MRFLCLHGRGTNSNILEAQLGKIHVIYEYGVWSKQGERELTKVIQHRYAAA